MHLSTHLLFRGECQEAFTFYAECFGASSLRMMTYGDSPAGGETVANWRDKIVHATLTVGDSTLSGADVLPEQHEKASGFYVLMGVDDIPDAERVFNALAKDGVVRMSLQRTFWSPAFGVVVDRFGTPWEINCAGERQGDSSPEP
jgi:PhnB protein